MKIFCILFTMMITLSSTAYAARLTLEDALTSMPRGLALELSSALTPKVSRPTRAVYQYYDSYLDVRYALLDPDVYRLVEFGLGRSIQAFSDEHGYSVIAPSADRSIEADARNLNGVTGLRISVPKEFERTVIEYLLYLHEIEHLIQRSQVMFLVESRLVPPDYESYPSTIQIVEESAIRAEWIFINSLPDELIHQARELILNYPWKDSKVDSLTRGAFLRALDAKLFRDPDEFLAQERFAGRRLGMSGSSSPGRHYWLGTESSTNGLGCDNYLIPPAL